MSETEKAAQIGEWMLLLQKQREHAAHLQGKLDRVAQAYKEFGVSRSSWRIDPNIAQVVRAGYGVGGMNLLNQVELVALMHEAEQAETAVAQTVEQLRGVGINV